ncbi:hypothetical protein [Roseomonas chloroacetimidivorans]|uniref:hypothetical protein n=1 Tax=Roseomonas chloroacetimidivorans TaxID=1766656 RepID=UPI003C762D64
MAEFRAFLDVGQDDAAHALAELAELQLYGAPGSIPASDKAATSARDLYCKRAAGWAVFYTAASPGGAFRVTVLHVAAEAPGTFQQLEAEADRRLRMI